MINLEITDTPNNSELRKELVHRFRNSAQMMSSIFNLQLHSIENRSEQEVDFKRALQDVNRRLITIAQIHQRLEWSNGLSKLDLASFVKHVAAQMEATTGQNIVCELSHKTALVDFDIGLSSGIILGEALSYFVERGKRISKGKSPIFMKLQQLVDRLQLDISAKGCNDQAELIEASKHCFGLNLIEDQAKYSDVNFDIELPDEPNDFIVFRLDIPAPETFSTRTGSNL